MKKIEIHLAISLSVILASCQLLRFSLCTPSRNFQFMLDINLTRFDNLAATLELHFPTTIKLAQ